MFLEGDPAGDVAVGVDAVRPGKGSVPSPKFSSIGGGSIAQVVAVVQIVAASACTRAWFFQRSRP